MNPTTKRVLMNHMKKSREEEERRRYGEYEPEDKFRDRRGREHYDNGRYAPMAMGDMRMGDEYYPDARRYMGGSRTVRNEDEMWADSRMRRDSRGRYMSPRSEYGNGYGDSHYDSPYVQPVYERDRGYRRDEYRPMNKIGFAIDGEMERIPDEAHHDYKTGAGYENMDEMSYRKGNERSEGHGYGSGYAPLTKQTAMEWAEQMENVDGTKGPHWSMEQVKQLMAQKKIDCPVNAFFLALNAMYSDYSRVAKESGVNNIDFYVKMAKAFLDDVDGPGAEEKVAKYYTYVVH